MKRLFIICHKDHLVSGSYAFFQELLQDEFAIEIIVYDFRLHFIETLVKAHPDAVYFLFQTEFLAPWFLTRGIKTVVFPMFDGCANAPPGYFRVLDNAYVFNFSKKLHARCTKSGIVSYPLTYYPPVKTKPVSWKAKQDRLFYWLRRPLEKMPEHRIVEFFSPYVGGFHIHDRPDGYNFLSSTSRSPDQFTATSDWFEQRQELDQIVANSRFYLAPRLSEGIGMAFLEAMSMGCVVFANNNSTHDQYIYHGHNGFLIDFESKDNALIRAQIRDAFEIIRSGKPIGENAREFMRTGRPVWIRQAEHLRTMAVALHAAPPARPGDYTVIERLLGRLLAQVYYVAHAYGYYVLALVAERIGTFAPLRNKSWLLKLIRTARKPVRAVLGGKWQ